MQQKKFTQKILLPMSACLFMMFVIFNSNILKGQPLTDLRSQLIGQWRNLTMHLVLINASHPDKNKVLDYNENNWEDSLHIKPIHTYFNRDNTFYSEYYTLKDSIFYKPTGKWALEGNNLTFYYEKPRVDTLHFTLSIKDNVATFKGMVDWNGDGKKDDEYIGTQRKQ